MATEKPLPMLPRRRRSLAEAQVGSFLISYTMPEDSTMVAPPSWFHSMSWPSILCRLPSGAVRTTGDRRDSRARDCTSSPLMHPRLFALLEEEVAAGSVTSSAKVSSLFTEASSSVGAKAMKSLDLISVRTGCPERVVRTLDELTEVSL